MSRLCVTGKRHSLQMKSPLGLSGKLEVLGSEAGIIVKPFQVLSRPCSAKKAASPVMVSTGKLEVLDSEDNTAVDKGELATRNGRYQQNPSTSSMQSSYHKTHIFDTTKRNSHMQETTDGNDEEAQSLTAHKASSISISEEPLNNSENCNKHKGEEGDDEGNTSTMEPLHLSNAIKTSESSGDDDENDEENEEDDDEENSETEGRRAPIQLLGEFLKAVMDRDYPMAKKLCEMILIYEPGNSEAVQFKPLIEAKLRIDEAAHQNDEDDDSVSLNSDEGGSGESDEGEEDDEYDSSAGSDAELSDTSDNLSP